jgi:hypothetical protein
MGILFGGPTPEDGQSAYEEAVAAGFIGTESQWLASLNGAAGPSAYQVAQSQGFTGTVAQWLLSLKGATGLPGPQGPAGQSSAPVNLGVAQTWEFSGTGTTNVTGSAGKYIKVGQLVNLAAEFSVAASPAVIKLPFPCAYSVSNLPIGFDGMDLSNQGANISILNSGDTYARIFTWTVGVPLVYPKLIRFAFSYMASY